ncbi:MAG: RnfABCDGE type electron transport complex subunit D [Erysipelotrichales bacterium]|nr:RnfABCDGE type electron transport complex subunit D [Erysipelotrichales bacterium]
MNSNVYVRSKTSIRSISLTRIIFLLPLIIYGFYKNGIYLYIHNYVSVINMFRPLYLIIIGAAIGGLVNIIYEKIIKKNKDSLVDILFSSFHIEYGIILGSLVSINTNIIIFTFATLIIFFISKLFKNHINIISLTFIVIYIFSIFESNYIFSNVYELSKSFHLNLFDYLIGRGPGGVASTHIILLGIALTGLYISNNNKFEITLDSCLTYGILSVIYSVATNSSILEGLFLYNYIYIFSFVATDMVTSCYTNRGKNCFGILVGVLTFAFRLLNPILAPFIAVSITSLFNNFIDRKVNKMERHD